MVQQQRERESERYRVCLKAHVQGSVATLPSRERGEKGMGIEHPRPAQRDVHRGAALIQLRHSLGLLKCRAAHDEHNDLRVCIYLRL